MTFRFLFLTSIMAATLCLFSACSAITLHSVSIVATENANENSLTAVDIVLIDDAKLLSALPKNAPEWFDKKTSLLASLGQSIEVVSLQIPPAALVDVKLPKGIFKVARVISYANYINAEGQVMGDLSLYTCAQITLQARRVSYANCR
jgi:hypothetical protein